VICWTPWSRRDLLPGLQMLACGGLSSSSPARPGPVPAGQLQLKPRRRSSTGSRPAHRSRCPPTNALPPLQPSSAAYVRRGEIHPAWTSFPGHFGLGEFQHPVSGRSARHRRERGGRARNCSCRCWYRSTRPGRSATAALTMVAGKPRTRATGLNARRKQSARRYSPRSTRCLIALTHLRVLRRRIVECQMCARAHVLDC